MTLQLKVITLNCWGIPDPLGLGLFVPDKRERLEAVADELASRDLDLVMLEEVRGVFTPGACSDRTERIAAIGEALSTSDYEVVLLEEIWTQSDYEKLVAKLHSTLPYTHYYHSGMFGSGVCIFSKYAILETSQHRFALNGYPHCVYHGDWFGGKCITLAKMDIKGFRVHVYGTHLHAQYNEDNDDYLAHRVSQAYELSQYIKLTSNDCDFLLAGGDFNLQPKDLGYKMIVANANVKDSWLSQVAVVEEEHGGTTCDRPDNKYHSPAWVARNPHGLRLDYLFYRPNHDIDMSCERCELTLRQVPGKDFPYSDHEGLSATYRIRRRVGVAPPTRDSKAIEEHFTAALPVLDTGEKRVKSGQVYYLLSLLICGVLLVFLSDMSLPYGLQFLLYLLKFIIVIAMGYYGWTAAVLSNFELNGIIATRKDINNILRCNPNPM